MNRGKAWSVRPLKPLQILAGAAAGEEEGRAPTFALELGDELRAGPKQADVGLHFLENGLVFGLFA